MYGIFFQYNPPINTFFEITLFLYDSCYTDFVFHKQQKSFIKALPFTFLSGSSISPEIPSKLGFFPFCSTTLLIPSRDSSSIAISFSSFFLFRNHQITYPIKRLIHDCIKIYVRSSLDIYIKRH